MLKRVSIEFAHNFFQAYCIRCKTLCREFHMPQTAFDILMFLANNPGYNTARDIVKLRGLKANLVSVNVDRLVQEGDLDRVTFQETDVRPCWCVRPRPGLSSSGEENSRTASSRISSGTWTRIPGRISSG